MHDFCYFKFIFSHFFKTALHYAAGIGKENVVLLLLQNGADPSIRTNDKHWDKKYRNKTATEFTGHSRIGYIIGTLFGNLLDLIDKLNC